MRLDMDSRLITKSRQQYSVRVSKMAKRCSEKGKKNRRKTLRGVKKEHVDKEKVLKTKESCIAGEY